MALFTDQKSNYELPPDYTPVKPRFFEPERIFLAKGSTSAPDRRRFVESVISVFPDAEVTDCADTPHNRIVLPETDPARRLRRGKKTLVVGEHKSAVRFSDEQGNTCPNYWHFSPYGFCPYGCKYCYLAGTLGVWHSPTVKIFVNLADMLAHIDSAARKLARPTAFYLGKLQDGLALDSLTGYSKTLVPFFAGHEFARQVLLTKSDHVDNLLPLEHGGRTILTWSLNPPEISKKFEENVPAIHERIAAMKKCAGAGYPLRAVIMPLIPVRGWKAIYAEFVRYLVSEVPLQRITMGGICIYKNARRLMERKIGRGNCISGAIEPGTESGDGRARYAAQTRIEMYRAIIKAVEQSGAQIPVALCLEEPGVWSALGLEHNLGRCNCVL